MKKMKFSIRFRKLYLVAVLIIATGYLAATNYYVDPMNGSIADDGSKEDPWRTLAEVFSEGKTFEAGDTIFLLSGHHGTVTVKGINDGYVTILPLEGHHPTCKRVTFSNAKKWRFQEITISPETAPTYERSTILTITNSASEIIVDSCFIYSVLDNTPWAAGDWVSNACSGANISGDNNVLMNSHFLNVDHGIIVESGGEDNLIANNVIENFSGDGMRGIGNYNTFEYNTVKNCYDVDDNHDDGFQSYSRGPGGTVGTGTVYGIVLRGNTILNYTDPDQPMRGTLQGMGCFDGMFEDWVIENNVVITSHWHGITLLGARNCLIINNTVVDRNNLTPGPPWIQIGAHKDGTLGTGNVIRNNLTTSMSNTAGIGTVDFNIIVSNYNDFFVDYDHFDLRLKEGCAAIDAGTDEEAPFIDKDGNIRPQGAGFDIGAYEYLSGPDTIPPVILSVTSIRPNEIEVSFNERLNEVSAQNIENYAIDNDIVVLSSVLSQNMKSVTLEVLNLEEEIEYSLIVNNVLDIAGNDIESNTTVNFSHVCGYVTATGTQEPNIPENTLDGDLATRWSAEGVQWIKYDMCVVHTISSLEMAFYYGDTRASNFKVEVGTDDENWTEVFTGSSSGTTAELEEIDISESVGRYLRITGSGNSSNAWNSYTEVVIGAEELIVDKTELSDSVTVANGLYDSGVNGSEILLAAIDSAQTVLDNESASQGEISMVFAVLINAMEQFRENQLSGLDQLIADKVRVYPNPFKNQLYIEVPEEIHVRQISLINLLGQRVDINNIKTINKLNVKELTSGMYLLQLFTDKGVINKRIIK